MLVAFGMAGVDALGGVGGWILGVVAVLVAVAVWSVWLAPKAMRPVERPVALVMKAVLFAGSATLVGIAGHVTFAVVLAVLAVVSIGLEVVLGPSGDAFEGLSR
jgi:hypothetical protein